MSDLDRQALESAIETARRLRPDLTDRYLAEKPWVEAAMDAARICQETALNLKPWECWPPCDVEIDSTDEPGLQHRSISKSAALLRRMLACGVSKYHPDPLAAIREAESSRMKWRSAGKTK
jgi:hypothetical protein